MWPGNLAPEPTPRLQTRRSVNFRGHGQESLPNPSALVENVAFRSDRIARFARLDLALAGAIDPDRIVVEVANDVPDLIGGVFGDRTIIAFCHAEASANMTW